MKINESVLRIIKVMSVIMVSLTTLIYIYITVIGTNDTNLNNSIQYNAKLKDFSTGWYDKDNNKVVLDPIMQNKGFSKLKTNIIYHDITEDIAPGDTLCFRSLSTYVTIYIDEKKVLSTPYKKTLLSCKSPGSVWSFYEFKESDIGKKLEMHVTPCYNDSSCYISQMSIGNSLYYITNYLVKNATSIAITIVTLFLGLLFIFADLYINISKKLNDHSLLHIGLFTGVMSVWCLFSTHVIELIPGTSQGIQYISCVFLFLIPYTAIVFVKTTFNLKNDFLLKGNCILIASLYFVATILQIANIADYHETLILTHISLGTGIVSVIYTLIAKQYKEGLVSKKKPHTKHFKGFTFGTIFILASLIIATIIDMIIYYNGRQTDVGSITRFTIIFVIIYVGLLASHNLYTLSLELNDSILTKRLAYQDTLTGIGNRTAFMLQISELENNIAQHPRITIISFDVNNLKFTNDTFGHKMGDDLIINAADIIKKSFDNEYSRLYRIGGDEFVVIIDSLEAETLYKVGNVQFNVNMNNFNNTYNKPYTLSIAHGYSTYSYNSNVDENNEHPLEDTLKISDDNMYRNKAEMKCQVLPKV